MSLSQNGAEHDRGTVSDAETLSPRLTRPPYSSVTQHNGCAERRGAATRLLSRLLIERIFVSSACASRPDT